MMGAHARPIGPQQLVECADLESSATNLQHLAQAIEGLQALIHLVERSDLFDSQQRAGLGSLQEHAMTISSDAESIMLRFAETFSIKLDRNVGTKVGTG